jgi:hypothetical protein
MKGPMIPESAIQNDLASGAQSFRREDNSLLPLSGLRSTVSCEVFHHKSAEVPRTKKDFVTARLGVFTPPGFRLALAVPLCYCGIRDDTIWGSYGSVCMTLR